MRGWRVMRLLCLAAVGACAHPAKPKPRPTSAAALDVTLTLGRPRIAASSDFEAQVAITNGTAGAVQLNTLDLPYPSLSLQVEDAAGKRVPLGPPPVPRVDDGVSARERLAPGQRFAFRLGTPFGFDLDPGSYRVRFYHEVSRRDRAPTSDWVGTLQSSWVTFEVVHP
jgi:hypothetical protein